MSYDNRHRFSMGLEAKRETVTRREEGNRLGAFTFLSLADVEAGRPTSFTRTIADSRSHAATWNRALLFEDLDRQGFRERDSAEAIR